MAIQLAVNKMNSEHNKRILRVRQKFKSKIKTEYGTWVQLYAAILCAVEMGMSALQLLHRIVNFLAIGDA